MEDNIILLNRLYLVIKLEFNRDKAVFGVLLEESSIASLEFLSRAHVCYFCQFYSDTTRTADNSLEGNSSTLDHAIYFVFLTGN